MSTVDEWTTAQQTAASAWMDAELVIDPGATNQELLVLIDLQPATGHWGYRSTVDRDANAIDYETWLLDFQNDDAEVAETDDWDDMIAAVLSFVNTADNAVVGANYVAWWATNGWIPSVPATVEEQVNPALTTDDMQDIREL